jgi:hypothetical protein
MVFLMSPSHKGSKKRSSGSCSLSQEKPSIPSFSSSNSTFENHSVYGTKTIGPSDLWDYFLFCNFEIKLFLFSLSTAILHFYLTLAHHIVPSKYPILWVNKFLYKMKFGFEHQKFNVRNSTSLCFLKKKIFVEVSFILLLCFENLGFISFLLQGL